MTPLERYARFLVRHAVAVLLIVGAVTALLVLGIGRLRAEFDVEASLPQDHPFVAIDRAIRREFGGRNTVIIAIEPKTGDVWRPDVLSVVHDLTLDALRLKNVIAQNVVSLAAPSVRFVEDKGDRIDADYLMKDVPQSPEEIARLRARVAADPQLSGLLVTPDDRAALLLVDFWEGDPAIDIAHRVIGMTEPYRDRGVDFFFAGEPTLALTDIEQSRDIAFRIPMAFGVIALMLLVSFRNLQGMLIPMLTAALSTVWGLGLMGYTGQVIDSWNVAVPILLIAIAAGHSAQMLKRYTEEVERLGDNREAVVVSTAIMGPVMIAAGGVATLGFASLALTGIRAIEAFGLACAYGIGSAVVLEMTFIPALRTLLPAPRIRPRGEGLTGRFLAVLERAILERGGRRVIVASVVVLALAVIGALRIRTYGSTREYMARDSLPRLHLEEIQRHFPGTYTMTVLYEGPAGAAKTLPFLRHMDGLRAEIERDPLVVKTGSLVDLVKMLHKTFNADAPDPYRLPDDQELVAQLMFLGASPAFERFTDRSQSKGLLVAYLRDDDSALVGPLVRGAQAWVDAHPAPDGVRVLIAGGAGPTVLAVNEHTTRSKVLNMLLVLATIYAVSSLVLRSPLGGLYVITPIVATIAVLFGLLGWTGLRLDMGSATNIAMAAGVGADYAIYFLYRLREERRRRASDAEALGIALRTSGRAVIFVAASIAAGFGVMGLSKFFGLRMFGTLMPTAMALSCLASLSLMPVLVLRTRPRFVFEGADVEVSPAVRSPATRTAPEA
ncbi:MAG TPA: MMPL family transporter [Candidatus Binatia bacterium]|nr:MMPL family transporter [Candidatus Binatia bacterium]